MHRNNLIPARGKEPAHYHYDIRYAFQYLGNEDYVISDESHDLDWVEIENPDQLTREGSMLRMTSKWTEIGL